MNSKIIILPIACLLATGCVSRSTVQQMIDTNNAEVIQPRLDVLDAHLDTLVDRLDLFDGLLGESKRLTAQQRKVLIRHFELLGELSGNALAELRKNP